MTDAPAVSVLGTTALLFEAPGETTLANQQRIWALAREAARWPEIREAVPGVNNLLLSFATPPKCLVPLETRLLGAWGEAEALPLGGRVVELPVTYGGEGGPHMADVVAHTGLSVEEIVAIMPGPPTRSTPSAAIRATATSAAWTRASPRRGARCR